MEQHLPDLDRFPRLTRPSIFLASPGDVAYLRKLTESVIEDVKQAVADDRDIDLYAWEVDKAVDGFDDRIPAQEQIPHPCDPKCRGVVCFFGEKVGQPLSPDHPIDSLAPIEPMRDQGAYGLVIPWDPEAAHDGGFALTGSTFELLATLATIQRARDEGRGLQAEIPLLLRFVGDPSVLDARDPLDAAWGNQQLLEAAQARYRGQWRFRKAFEADYENQILQLHNLARFLIARGKVPQFVANEDEAEAKLRDWLETQLHLRTTVPDADPFKGLEAYDVADHAIFCGRKAERREARQDVEARFQDRDKPNIHWVQSGSGAGKSSFLRAGLVGSLVHDRRHDITYIDCVLRPGELLPHGLAQEAGASNGELSFRALRNLDQACLERVAEVVRARKAAGITCDLDPEEIVARALRDFDRTAAEPAAKAATAAEHLDRLMEDLPRRNGVGTGRARLLIALDQFEEALDGLYNTETAAYWEPVVAFMNAAAGSDSLAVLVTLQDNRVELVKQDATLGPLYDIHRAGRTELMFPSNALAEIIREPFKRTGRIAIAPDLVQRLRADILEFCNKQSRGDAQDNLLPLVSLTLRRLYDNCARPKLEGRPRGARNEADAGAGAGELATEDGETAKPGTGHDRDDGGAGSLSAQFDADKAATTAGREAPARATLTVEDAEGFLRIDDSITELAEEALEEAREKAGPSWSDTAVGDLLRPLVDWRNEGGTRFTLPDAAMPTAAAPRELAKAMLKRRLLLPERDGRIRLVHEAVLRRWDAARQWIEEERPLREAARQLRAGAADWDPEDRDSETARALKALHLDRAARILALWYDILHDDTVTHKPEETRRLRDFCLSLLQLQAQPGSVVKDAPNQPTHLMLAAAYQRADIVHGMLASDRTSVDAEGVNQRTALFWPAFLDNGEILEMLLDAGARPDPADKDGWRPIHAAAQSGSLACLRRLIEAGASLEAGGAPNGMAPIHLAANAGRTEVLRYLVETAGISPETLNAPGGTPLHVAATADQAEAIRVLVELGAKVEASNDFGFTPLHFAARDKSPEAVEALLDCGAAIDARLTNHNTPLHLAVHNGHVEIARRLLARGAKVNATALNDWSGQKKVRERIANRLADKPAGDASEFDRTPLHYAAVDAQPEVIPLLLDKGADPDARTGAEETPLHLAARHDRHDLVEQLGRGEPDLEARDADGRTPLQVALKTRHFEAARALASLGAKPAAPLQGKNVPPRPGWTALHEAAFNGDAEVARCLLELDVPVDVQNEAGQTPLHLAAAGERREVAELLLSEGASPDRPARDGNTPLHLACLADTPDVGRLLLPDSLAGDRPDGEQATPLHLAAARGSIAMTAMLLDCGHPADVPDFAGWTPLHAAVQNGHEEVAARLLEAGAGPARVAGRPAATPAQLAAEAGHARILARLHEAGADIQAAMPDRPPPIVLALRFGHAEVVRELIGRGVAADGHDPESGQTLAALHLDRLRREAAAGRDNGPDPEVLAWLRAAGHDIAEEVPAPPPPPPAETPRPAPAAPWNHPWEAVSPATFLDHWTRGDAIDGKYPVRPESLQVRRCELPWYRNVALLQLRDPAWEPAHLRIYYLLAWDRELYRLNGTSPAIHEVNAHAPIVLTPANVLDYLRFFCFFVRGKDGPFHIVEREDDPLIPREPQVVRVVSACVRPATFEGWNDKGHYRCDAVVYYSNALFFAHFAVQPTGMVEMLDDEPIAADLPGRIDAPIA